MTQDASNQQGGHGDTPKASKQAGQAQSGEKRKAVRHYLVARLIHMPPVLIVDGKTLERPAHYPEWMAPVFDSHERALAACGDPDLIVEIYTYNAYGRG